LPLGDIGLIPFIETARGTQQIDAILAAGTRAGALHSVPATLRST
jgi:hypothetical protein